jgi:nucleoside-diphosphate-sugar epimerase
MSTAHVDNVCHALELAVEKGRGGEAYFISDGADSTLKEVISVFLQTRPSTRRALQRRCRSLGPWPA